MRINNFAALRLIAALFILTSHLSCYYPNSLPFAPLGGWRVPMFFSISGYLVAGSWLSDPNAGRFLARRFLRLWPAMAVMVFAVYVELKLTGRNTSARELLPQLWFDGDYTQVNVALWTMRYEVLCYCVAAALFALVPQYAKSIFLGVVLFALIAFWRNDEGVKVLDTGAFFAAGVLLRIAKPHRYAQIACLLAGWFVSMYGHLSLSTLLMVPILSVWVGNQKMQGVEAVTRYGDMSYGIFLWHSPIITYLVFPYFHTFPTAAAATVVLSCTAGLLSWHIVEKKALLLKPRNAGVKSSTYALNVG